MDLMNYTKEIEWSDFSSLGGPQTYATACSVNNKIFLIGGLYENGSFASDMKIWDQEWKPSEIYFSIHHACSFINDGHILIFGGSTDVEDFQDLVYRLDPLHPNIEQIINTKQLGVRGHFGGRSMKIAQEKGSVFAEDGELVIYENSTFVKTEFK